MPYPQDEQGVRSRLCWSADIDESPKLIAQAKLMPGLEIAKVDRVHVDDNGFGVFYELNELGIKVFDDAKPSEIPSKLEKLARIHCKHRPWMLNCMASTASGGLLTGEGREELEGLKRFADVCHQNGVRPCAVTVLTCKTGDFALKEYGKSAEEQVLLYVELLLDCGFTDIVCSPQEVPMIRAESRFDALSTINPGIKRSPGSNKDQARTATPAEAFHLGCDVLVIGRDLTTGDPVQNMSDIVADVLAAA